jgi:hypothetical protein
VTGRLGLVPTRVVVKGEQSPPNSLGRSRLGKLNAWFLTSEDLVDSKDVRQHLDWLLERLQRKPEALLDLQKEPGVRMYVHCPWWSEDGGGGPTLWPEQMRGMAELNLECTFSFADYSDEGGESAKDDAGAETA